MEVATANKIAKQVGVTENNPQRSDFASVDKVKEIDSEVANEVLRKYKRRKDGTSEALRKSADIK